MIQGELARREGAESSFLPFTFIIDEGGLTDVSRAVQAIEEERESRTSLPWPDAAACAGAP
jgi:hypothetical protein